MGMTRRRAMIVLLLTLCAPLARAERRSTPAAPATPPATTQSAVVIERSAPDVTQRTFDPKNPPSEMPALRPGEAAVTESNFSCQTVIAATIVDQIPSSGGCTTTVRITNVRTTIKLGIVIWLPERGSRKLTAHENGHRAIDEQFYAGAEDVARRLSEAMIGQRRVGKGATCDAAAQAAIKEAGDQLCGDYMAAVQYPATRVQELYDEITDHGRNRIREQAAIQRAVDQQKKEAADKATTTKPAS
jgi:hypothetical protein